MKIGTDTIRGVDVDIEVDARSGFFTVSQDGDRLASDRNLDDAKRKAGVELSKRRVKVAVAFALEDGRRGVADGIHARNRTILCTIDGERDAIEGYRGRGVLSGEITDEELAKIAELDKQIGELKRQRHEITEPHEMDLGTVVKAAIAEKAGATDGG